MAKITVQNTETTVLSHNDKRHNLNSNVVRFDHFGNLCDIAHHLDVDFNVFDKREKRKYTSVYE